MRRHFIRGAAILAAALALGGAASAQDAYPSKPVRIVIGFAAGSGTDVTARLIAQELQNELKQTFIVDNKPGAAVQIAANLVKQAPPDGYTLLLTSNSSHSVNPHVFKTLSYDPIADFTPIGGVASIPFVVAVNGSLPVQTLPELATYAQANRGKVFWGYSGTVFRVPGETINRVQKLGATAVPFKSSPEVMTELIAGRLQWMIIDLASSQAHRTSGRIRALALTGGKRSALAPDLPTVEETLKIPDFDMAAWVGLFGPAHLPKPVADKLSGALVRILNRPEVRQRMLAANIDPMPMEPAVFGDFVKSQLRSWGVRVKEAGIEPE